MAVLPRFTDKDGGVYTFTKARFLPVSEPIRPNQIVGKAGGGQVKVADMGTKEEFFPFIVNRVSKTARDDLIDFFDDPSVNYKQYSFTFRDEDSVSYSVRLDSDTLDFPHVRGDLYNLRFALRKEITS